jgi:hypothetical protein
LVAQHFRRFVRVRVWYFKRKRKRAALPIVFARFDFNLEVHQVVLAVRELNRHPFFQLQLG